MALVGGPVNGVMVQASVDDLRVDRGIQRSLDAEIVGIIAAIRIQHSKLSHRPCCTRAPRSADTRVVRAIIAPPRGTPIESKLNGVRLSRGSGRSQRGRQ